MRLTRFSDYALRCLMVLGLEADRPVTLHTIAEQMHMSYEHLAKIVQRLSDLGYVETIRGRHGGVRLAQPASAIRLGEVVRQTEESWALVECFEPTGSCPVAPACRLGGVLDEALSAFLGTLDQFTLADVIEPRQPLLRLMRR